MGLAAGYLASITVNSVLWSDYASQATRSATVNVLDKTKLGQATVTKLKGLEDSTISVQLHADTSLAAALEAAYANETTISYVFRAGAVGVADLGQYAGDCIVADFSYDASADSEWNVSMSLECTGPYTYTQPL